MMVSPFGFAALHVTVAWVSPRVTVGVPVMIGTPAGVTVFEATDAGDVPIELVAVTVKV